MSDLRQVDTSTLRAEGYRKSMPLYEISLRPQCPRFTLFYIMMDYLEKIITFGCTDEIQMHIFKDDF